MRKYLLIMAFLFCVTPLFSSERGKTIITNDTGNVNVRVERNGGLAVNLQDQTTLALDLYFAQQQGSATTLNADTTVDISTISVTDTTGFNDGSWIGIFSGVSGERTFYFAEQIGAPSGSVITLNTPLDFSFDSGDPVITSSRSMNIAGSTTNPQVFQVGGFTSDIEIDITRIMGYMQSGSAMDDSDFGHLAELTNGVVFRLTNGRSNNLWTVKTNGELALVAFDFSYTEKAPAGSFGARFRNTYAGQEKHGVAIRLSAGETLDVIIQDDLSALEEFRMMAQGHIVIN